MLRTIHASAHCTGLPSKSVHLAVTSPPYLIARTYAGDQNVDWPEVTYTPMPGLPSITIPPIRCGLGEEPTPEVYTAHLVLVAREMHRILRDDGVFVVNLGDKRVTGPRTSIPEGNLYGLPWRFALAMQADGWILRDRAIWAKGLSGVAAKHWAGNNMPSSAEDRLADAHEDIFVFAKQRRYYWDNTAIREPGPPLKGAAGSFSRQDSKGSDLAVPNQVAMSHRTDRTDHTPSGHNTRNVLTFPQARYTGAHYATFPEELPALFIKAGTSQHGCCTTCEAPYRRIVEKTFIPQTDVKDPAKLARSRGKATDPTTGWKDTPRGTIIVQTLGWEPTCDCDDQRPIPCTVLDPFCGSGTTLRAAARLGRNVIGLDISGTYLSSITAERVGDGFQVDLAT